MDALDRTRIGKMEDPGFALAGGFGGKPLDVFAGDVGVDLFPFVA